jgi:hypothetical protein
MTNPIASEPGGILSPLPDDHVKPAPVVLRYVGHLSPHGTYLPPPGVPGRDLTQADIDDLPMLPPKLGETPDGSARLELEPARRMTLDDLLAYDPPIFASDVSQSQRDDEIVFPPTTVVLPPGIIASKGSEPVSAQEPKSRRPVKPTNPASPVKE